jgi:hypothetical protein
VVAREVIEEEFRSQNSAILTIADGDELFFEQIKGGACGAIAIPVSLSLQNRPASGCGDRFLDKKRYNTR